MAEMLDNRSLDVECKDPRTYYRQVSTDWIEQTQTLDILPFANLYSGDDEPDNDFPSWVINWDLPTRPTWARGIPCRFGIVPYDKPLRHTFLRKCWDFLFVDCLGIRAWCIDRYEGATPGTQPLWAFHEKCESLSVSGIILTQINSHFRPSKDKGSQGLASVLYDGLTGMNNADFKKSWMPLKVFMRMASGSPERHNLFPMWKYWCELLRSARHQRGKEWVEDLMVTDDYFRAMNNAAYGVLQDEGLSMVCCEANEMAFGGPAVAARGAQAGDTVALVSGVSYPLVLRPVDKKRFRLIGPLFLPGVMDGELKEALKPELFHEMVLV